MKWIPTSADYEAVREAVQSAYGGCAAHRSIDLAPDLAAWIAHLAELRAQLESGVLEAKVLTADEAAGVQILNEEAEKFSRKKRCARCGAATDGLFNCTECGAKMETQQGKR